MTYLEPLFEQSNWAWDFLPLLLSLAATVYFWLWPAAIFAFAFSSFNPLVTLVLVLMTGLVLMRKKELNIAYPFQTRTWIQMAILMGLALTWPVESNNLWPNFAMAGLPFVLILPLSKWMKQNSGGALFLAPCLILGWSMIYLEGPHLSEASRLLACMLIFLMLLMAWYRQIPQGIKFLLLLSAMVASVWVLGDRLELVIVMFGFLAHKLFSKWLWGKSFCHLYLGVWSQLGLVLLALALSNHSQNLNILHLCFACALMFMGNQEICRLCVASAKCREVVLSWWVAKLPLLYLLLVISGLTPGPEIFLMLCFAGLAQEISKSMPLKPIKIEDLAENPCKEDFAVSLN